MNMKSIKKIISHFLGVFLTFIFSYSKLSAVAANKVFGEARAQPMYGISAYESPMEKTLTILLSPILIIIFVIIALIVGVIVFLKRKKKNATQQDT